MMAPKASRHTNENGDPPKIHIGQLTIRFLIDGPLSGKPLTIFEFIVPSGAKVPAAHSHVGLSSLIR
jgi:hypothetical protein